MSAALLGVIASCRRSGSGPSYGFQLNNARYTVSNGGRDASFAVVPAGASGLYNNLCGVGLSGKTYWEMSVLAVGDSTIGPGIGLFADYAHVWNAGTGSAAMVIGAGPCGNTASGAFWGSGFLLSAYAWGVGDRIGFAYDASTRNLWVRKNGVWLTGDPATGTSPMTQVGTGYTYYPGVCINTCTSTTQTASVRLYGRTVDFANAAPSGFAAYAP
jgi:hypothetical protein